MIRNEVLFTLKDGRIASLHTPTDDEIPGLIEYLIVAAEETHFLSSTPEERQNLTWEKEQKFLEDMRNSPYNTILVCTVDGKVAGSCDVRLNKHQRMKHRASVGIALVSEFWNLGIGTQMFKEMFMIAKEKGVTQMELDFVEGNSRARSLYEKMGFKIVACLPRAVRLENGTYLDEYRMIKLLD